MIFEFMLYIFIGIGFFTGLIRGWKKELFNLASLVVALFVVLLSYSALLGILNNVFSLSKIYDIAIVGKILGWFGISVHSLEFVVVGLIPAIIVYIVLSKVFNAIFFSTKKVIEGKVKEGNKLLGALVGILSGFVLGVFLLFPVAASTFTVNLNYGPLTKVVVNSFPFVKSVLASLGVTL